VQEICSQYVLQLRRVVLVLQPIILERDERISVAMAGRAPLIATNRRGTLDNRCRDEKTINVCHRKSLITLK